MKLHIHKIIPNMVVHYIEQDGILASSNYTIYNSLDEAVSFNKVADLKVPFLIQMLSRFRLFARGLRLGIRSLKKLNSRTILAIADRKIFRLKNDARIIKRIYF